MPRMVLSKQQWTDLGQRAGWLSATAQADANPADLESTIRSSLSLPNYGKAFSIKSKSGGGALSEAEAMSAVVSAIRSAVNASPGLELSRKIAVHVAARRPFRLGVYAKESGGRSVLVPTFNGMGEDSFAAALAGALSSAGYATNSALSQSGRPGQGIVEPSRSVSQAVEFVMKANAAGILAGHSVVTIYGAHAQRGTHFGFTEMDIRGVPASISKDAVLWFTNIENEAVKNKIFSDRKQTFSLTRKSEILPLLSYFGVLGEYQQFEAEIKEHDSRLGLTGEGMLKDWQTKAKRVDIRLADKWEAVFAAVKEKMFADQTAGKLLAAAGVADAKAIFDDPFLQGLAGKRISRDAAAAALGQASGLSGQVAQSA